MEKEITALNGLELAFLDSLATYEAIFNRPPRSVEDWRAVLKEVATNINYKEEQNNG